MNLNGRLKFVSWVSLSVVKAHFWLISDKLSIWDIPEKLNNTRVSGKSWSSTDKPPLIHALGMHEFIYFNNCKPLTFEISKIGFLSKGTRLVKPIDLLVSKSRHPLVKKAKINISG